MAGETKLEDESDHQTPTNDFPIAPESNPKATKSKSQSSHKGSPASTSASASASAKRRCVSTACIACRRRKSKVPSCSAIGNPAAKLVANRTHSATAIHRAVLLAPPFTGPNVSMTPIQTIAARASTRKTSTTSRLATPPYKPSSRPSSITRRTRSQTWSNK